MLVNSTKFDMIKDWINFWGLLIERILKRNDAPVKINIIAVTGDICPIVTSPLVWIMFSPKNSCVERFPVTFKINSISEIIMPAADTAIPAKDTAFACGSFPCKNNAVPNIRKRIAVLGAIGTDAVPNDANEEYPEDQPIIAHSPKDADSKAKIRTKK